MPGAIREKLGGLVHLAVLVIQSAMTFTSVRGFGEESPFVSF